MNVDYKRTVEHIGQLSRLSVFFISLLLIVVLCVIDHFLGYEISFSIFYLLPVAFASWFGSKKQGVVVSVLSATAWLFADLTSGHMYSHFLIPVWNSIMRMGFFLMGTFSLSTIKQLLLNERLFARKDFLTDVYNSRAFTELAKAEMNRSERLGEPFTIVYMDIDNFKEINDRYGHSKGDALLQLIAATIKQNLRHMDIIARLGGDEFALLFPQTDETNTRDILQRLRDALLRTLNKNGLPVTFSMGAVTCRKECNIDQLINKADALMYEVKRRGKNGIEYAVCGK